MSPTFAALAALAALALTGCSDKPAHENRADGHTQAPPPGVVRVVFDLPGDDIGGSEAEALLADVTAALLERRAGRILRSGFGMGQAEIVLQVQDADAPEKIRQAVAAARPQAKYRIARDGR